MASVTSRKRSSIRARSAGKKSPFAPKFAPTLSKKSTKRQLKHNDLLTRVRDSGIQKTGTTTQKKRRRPANKLPAADSISTLAGALPNLDNSEDEWEGFEDGDTGATKRRRAKSGRGMQSLRLRPGAMKRKATMEKGERERFGRNLAGMVRSGGEADGSEEREGSARQKERWEALRAQIGGSLERDRGFGKG